MGELNVTTANTKARASFIRHLLNDLQALEKMLDQGLIEDDIIRIGAEQEFCLVTDNWRPSTKWDQVLEAINDPHYTSELARFNLEINLDPLEFKTNCFRQMETHLRDFLTKASTAAADLGDKILLTGILPTISKRQLNMDYMTPLDRYRALNDMMKALRGSDFGLHIRGIDELTVNHESVLFEACNTSFQLHLQIAPQDFISSYNWSQAIAGPLLSVCANSPLLMGRELWAETRIALFQQSIDTRTSSYALKEQLPRVSFGDNWANGSVAEIFKNDIACHRVLLSKEITENALQQLDKGEIPKLQALALHSGTIYHWNRPCYGVGGGKAHLRIENRYIPAGPTVTEEIANFAFWVGLMKCRPAEYDDLPAVMDFRDAKSNFIKAARTGRESVLRWKGEQIAARDLVSDHLLPIAQQGLANCGINSSDIDHYLSVIKERCKGMTGAQWIIKNYRNLKKAHKKDDAILMLTKSMYGNQETGHPVHQWPPVDPGLEAHEASHLVGHIMSTQLFTVNENDLADLAISVMEWKNIHHLPVENNKNQLTGLLTWTHFKKYQEKGEHSESSLVAEIMTKDLITVRPETEIKTAITLMKKNEIGCLPVVLDFHLVGIVTINDVKPYDHG